MISTLDQLVALRESARPVTVGTINGAFDVIHSGHIEIFTECRLHCGFLIALVNSDASVRRYKGPDRPFYREIERAEVIGALRAVDAVGIFDEDDPSLALNVIVPDVHFLGLEYADLSGKEYALRPVPERAVVEALGGRIVFLGGKKREGTSGLIERIRATL